jgi:hypothetical protein
MVTKKDLMADLKEGKFDIGGTKVYSFFINILDPDYKWRLGSDIDIEPSTIDRWMIRVFFHDPLKEIVDDMAEAGVIGTLDSDIKIDKKDKPDKVQLKKDKHLEKQKNDIINAVIMQMFGTDKVRQNLVYLLNKLSVSAGLSTIQLQALAWVQIRQEFGEPAAKFGKFEDVMDYSKETTQKIVEIGKDLEFIRKIGEPIRGKFNDAVRTINILASGPRFKFVNPQDVYDTIENRGDYETVFRLPEKVGKVKGANPDHLEQYLKTRIAEKDDHKNADIYVLSVSKKKPVHHVVGNDRMDTIKKSVAWILEHV